MFPGIIWSFLFGLSSDDFGWHNAVLPGWFVPRQGLSLTFVFVIISCSISCHGFYKWCRFSWLKLEAMLTLKCVIVQYPSTIPTRSMLLWQNIHFEPSNLFLSTRSHVNQVCPYDIIEWCSLYVTGASKGEWSALSMELHVSGMLLEEEKNWAWILQVFKHRLQLWEDQSWWKRCA